MHALPDDSAASASTGALPPSTIVRTSGTGASVRVRLVAGAVAVVSLALLVAAHGLTPSPEGHGTHVHLGLPPCAWAALFDRPCPTCGITTAVVLAARGHLLQAVRVQPVGLLLALMIAGTFWGAVHVAATGSNLWRLTLLLARPRVLWSLAAVAALAWAYKWATW